MAAGTLPSPGKVVHGIEVREWPKTKPASCPLCKLKYTSRRRGRKKVRHPRTGKIVCGYYYTAKRHDCEGGRKLRELNAAMSNAFFGGEA
jgi:hypothetical protein